MWQYKNLRFLSSPKIDNLLRAYGSNFFYINWHFNLLDSLEKILRFTKNLKILKLRNFDKNLDKPWILKSLYLKKSHVKIRYKSSIIFFLYFILILYYGAFSSSFMVVFHIAVPLKLLIVFSSRRCIRHWLFSFNSYKSYCRDF